MIQIAQIVNFSRFVMKLFTYTYDETAAFSIAITIMSGSLHKP